jgi:hypothetical protein
LGNWQFCPKNRVDAEFVNRLNQAAQIMSNQFGREDRIGKRDAGATTTNLFRFFDAFAQVTQQDLEPRLLVDLGQALGGPILLLRGLFDRRDLHRFRQSHRTIDVRLTLDDDLNGEDMFAATARRFVVGATAMRLFAVEPRTCCRCTGSAQGKIRPSCRFGTWPRFPIPVVLSLSLTFPSCKRTVRWLSI